MTEDNTWDGIQAQLRGKGSRYTAFDGNTPPPAVFPDPLDSSNSALSAYKGITPPGYISNMPQ